MEELLVGVVGAVESGEGGGVVTVEVFECGGFVGTKCFVERVFDLGAEVNGGSEVLQDGFFGGCLGLGVRAEMVCDLGDGLLVFGG